MAEHDAFTDQEQETRPVVDADRLATLPAGSRVGKYRIAAVMGQGSFGITYRATDTTLDRDVAIKEYLPTDVAARQPNLVVLPRTTQLAEDFRWGRERFMAEAKTLARLEKVPGVVNVYDFLEVNGTAYMVMELIDGETLEARLKRDGALPDRLVDRMLDRLLTGLEAVHAADILHRDIKPANILLDRAGEATLIDFGAARMAVQGRTQAMTAIYTPGYAAFEQFTSARQGPWTDIYALGATLYHGIAGAAPPSASDRMIGDSLVPATRAGQGRYRRELLAAIDAALALKAADRPQSIAAWRQRIRPAEPAATRPRSRWPLWLAAAAVIACIGASGVYLKLQADEAARQEALRADAIRIEAEAKRRTEEEAKRKVAEAQAKADALAKRQAEEAELNYAGSLRRCEDETVPTIRLNVCTTVIQSSLASVGDLALAYYHRGLAYLDNKDQARAVQDLSDAIRRRPDFAAALSARGVAYHDLGKLDLAQADYDEGLRLNPDDAVARTSRAILYNLRRQYDKAIVDLDRAIALAPDFADAYRQRGFALNETRQYDRALRDLDQAIKLKPENASSWLYRGSVYAKMKRDDRAIQDFDQAIKLDPKRASAYTNRGVSYENKRQFDRALQDHDQAIKIDPSSSEAWLARGRVYNSQGKYERAVQDFDQAIRLAPTSAYALINRAVAFTSNGQYGSAVRDFDEAIKLDPRLGDAWYGRGLAYQRLQQNSRAIQDYDQAIRIDPNDSQAIRNRAEAAAALARSGR